MTKEELKKEAVKYGVNNCGDCYGCHKKYRRNKNCERLKSVVKTYLASAEPREKRIEELEKENAVLILGNKSLSEKLMNTTREKLDLQKENAELKKENQKWKDGIALKDEEIGCIETEFNTFKSKAKEIIKTFCGFCSVFNSTNGSFDNLIAEAEQFLKDCEVEK